MTVDAASMGGPALVRALRRADRRRRIGALALVVPLFAFLMFTFFLPLAGMLRLSVEDDDFVTVMPRTTAALATEEQSDIPGEPVFAALAEDIREATAAKTIAAVARRLNYDVSGLRTTVMSTSRNLPDTLPAGASWTEALVSLDEAWSNRETWGAIRRAAHSYTDFYLLTAIDLKRDAEQRIVTARDEQAIYLDVLARTFSIALIVTIACMILGFPVAHLLATAPTGIANLLMILVLLPFWTSLLVRTTAWVVLLQSQGVVNTTLQWLGLIGEPLQLIYNRTGVLIAMTHVLLPYMVLPLYSVMRSIPPAQMRAATSLGATPFKAFLRVYLPQTFPGIGAGGLLVFILALGYYITPALVGGAADQMISYFITFYTTSTINWGLAAALGTVLLVATLILYWVYGKLVGVERMGLG